MSLRHWTVFAVGSFWAIFFFVCALRQYVPTVRDFTPGDKITEVVARALWRAGHNLPQGLDPGSALSAALFLLFAVLVVRIVDYEAADGGSALGIGLIVTVAVFICLGLLDRTAITGSMLGHPFAAVLSGLVGSFVMTVSCGSLRQHHGAEADMLGRERLVQDLLVRQYKTEWKTSSPTSSVSRSATRRTSSPPPV